MFEEIPTLIRKLHDRAVADGTGCTWPERVFGPLALLAARCAFLQAKRRATIADVLPELESLLQGGKQEQKQAGGGGA